MLLSSKSVGDQRFSSARKARAMQLVSLALLLLVLVLVLHEAEARTSSSLKVELPHGGVLVGRHLTSHKGRHLHAFMGVPYAQPPVGKLRFKPPVPYQAWTGEKLAVRDSAKCIQRDPYRRDFEIEGSEDCLYLNVYTPEEPHKQGPLPVMVWFHGGGWMCGSGISGFYGPDYLMDHDIVLVSANFRLGPLGFLSTETTDCPGNFGMKDQVEVLKWVHRNIASFGGDPNSVTLFGESAGGASVTYHMLSEQSKGLFHRGIAQSGTYLDSWAQPAQVGVPAQRARKLAQLLGCNAKLNWSQILACLRQKEAKDIAASIYDFYVWDYDPMIPFTPVVEPEHQGAFLTVSPRGPVVPHGYSLPLMLGVTSEEGLLKTASMLNIPGLLEEFKQKFQQILPVILYYDHHTPKVQQEITHKIEQFYFKEGHNYNKQQHHNLTDLISDGWFTAGVDEYMRLRMDHIKSLQEAHKEVPATYVYLFNHKSMASFSEVFLGGREEYYGACHAEELQYLFPVGHELFVSAQPTKADVNLREAMLSMWVNFANSSNPTPVESAMLPTWKPTHSYPVNYARIGSNNEEERRLLVNEQNLYQDRVDFWHELKAHLPADQRQKDEL